MWTHFPSTPLVAMSASKLMVTLGERSGVFDEAIDKAVNLWGLLECVQRYVSLPAHLDRV